MCISYHGNSRCYWRCPGQLRPFDNAHFLLGAEKPLKSETDKYLTSTKHQASNVPLLTSLAVSLCTMGLHLFQASGRGLGPGLHPALALGRETCFSRGQFCHCTLLHLPPSHSSVRAQTSLVGFCRGLPSYQCYI